MNGLDFLVSGSRRKFEREAHGRDTVRDLDFDARCFAIAERQAAAHIRQPDSRSCLQNELAGIRDLDTEPIRFTVDADAYESVPGSSRDSVLDSILNQRLNGKHGNRGGERIVIDIELSPQLRTEPQSFNLDVRAD